MLLVGFIACIILTICAIPIVNEVLKEYNTSILPSVPNLTPAEAAYWEALPLLLLFIGFGLSFWAAAGVIRGRNDREE